MLGQELILLACACTAAEEEDIPAVIASWTSLRPEERWWIAGWLQSHASDRVMRGAALLLSGGQAMRKFEEGLLSNAGQWFGQTGSSVNECRPDSGPTLKTNSPHFRLFRTKENEMVAHHVSN
jgi:hypothetical protein